jgi:hypothetical protein
MDEIFLKRAKLFDEMADRADIRRARALKLGNRREAEGAKLTALEAHDSARRLRASVGR